MPEDNVRDINYRQSRDGFMVNDQTPFSPLVELNFVEPPEGAKDESWDLEQYKVKFNQGYVLNTVSETQYGDFHPPWDFSDDQGQITPPLCPAIIQNMDHEWILGLEHDVQFYVSVVINRNNFLLESATFTGISGDQLNEFGIDFNSNFPANYFTQFDGDEYHDSAPKYTGFFPVLRLVDGDVQDFVLRDNIVLSDRQLCQRGNSVKSASAHVMIAEGRDDQYNPTRFRTIKAGTGITVEEDGDYIVINSVTGLGTSGDGSGIWSGQNVGGGAEVYKEYTLLPSEFRTLTGEENIEITWTEAGDTIEIKSEDDICGSASAADWWAYVEDSKRPAKFRGLKAGSGVYFDGDDCVTTISVDTGWMAHTGCCTGEKEIEVETIYSHGNHTTYLQFPPSSPDEPQLVADGKRMLKADPDNEELIVGEPSVFCAHLKSYGQVESLGWDASSYGRLKASNNAGTPAIDLNANVSADSYINGGPFAVGHNSPTAGTSLDVKGLLLVQDNSDSTYGTIQLGDNVNQTISIEQSTYPHTATALKLGSNISRMDAETTSDYFEFMPSKSTAFNSPQSTTNYKSPSTGSPILGGFGNHISGNYNVIVGGSNNSISGKSMNFIGGGSGVDITDSEFSVSVGGRNNDITGSNWSVLGGGYDNLITGGNVNTVGGGYSNELRNVFASVIAGGHDNLISGTLDSSTAIAGGVNNEIINSTYAFIGAGGTNVIEGDSDGGVIVGGVGNKLKGTSAFIGGGRDNAVSGTYGVALGSFAKVQEGHNGAFVFSDANLLSNLSSGANTMVMGFKSGVYIQTDSGLYINGNPVLTGETPEGDTLQTVTARGNLTTTDIISEGEISGASGLFNSTVGIGTNAGGVNAPLTVEGDGGTSAEFREGGVKVRYKATEGTIALAHVGSEGRILASKPNWGQAYPLKIAADYVRICTSGGSAATEVARFTEEGNVGIGTSDPSNKLEILSTDGWQSRFSYDSSRYVEVGYQGIKGTYGSNNNDLYVSTVSAGSDGGNIIFNTINTERARITNSGNVGIGTSNPSKKLQIKSDDNAFMTEVVKVLSNNEAQYTALGYSNLMASHELSLFTLSANPISFRPNSIEKMHLTTGGYLGIGTDDPEVQLHVKAADGVTGVLKIEGGKDTVTSVGEINSEIQFGSNDPSIGQDNVAGKISSVTEYNNGAFAGLAFYTYYQTTANLAERVRFTYDGKVGIGLTNPDNMLHVEGADEELARFKSTDNDARIAIQDNTDTVYIGHDASADLMQLGFNSTMGSTDNLSINTAGAVGIGSTSPVGGYSLNVTGDIFVGDNSAGAVGRNFVAYSASLGVGKNSVATIVGKSVKASSTTNNSLVTLPYSTDGTLWYKQSYAAGHTWHRTTGYATSTTISETEGELMRLTTGGNVGIGVTNPDATLEIQNGTTSASVYGLNINDMFKVRSDGVIYWGSAYSYGYQSWTTNKAIVGGLGGRDLGLHADGAEKVTIKTDGKVGIGTTAPTTDLEVWGQWIKLRSSTTDAELVLSASDSTTNNSIIKFGDNDNSNIGQIKYAHSGDSMRFITNTSEAMRIDEDGNLCLGNTSAGGKLDILTDSSTTNGVALRLESSTGSYLIVKHGGDVGIGTHTPAYELDVVGTIHGSSGNFESGITVNGNPVLTGTSAYETDTLQTVTDDGNTTTNSVHISNAGFGADYAPLTVSGGQGGGTAPVAFFRGTGTAAYLQFQNSTTSYGSASQVGLTVGNNGNDGYVFNREPASLYFGTSGEARMTILGDSATHSKVGIGTVSPSSTAGSDSFLDIYGATDAGLVISSNNGDWDIKNTNPNADLVFYRDGSHRVTFAQAGNVGIGSQTPARKLDVVGDAAVSTNLVVGTAVYTDQWIANSSATQYIKNSSAATSVAITNAGNVGIATSTPYAYDTTATKLHVKNTGAGISEVARFEGSSDADGAGAIVRIGTSNDRGIYLEGGRTGDVPYASIGTTEYDGAKTEAIHIDSAGKVGIGTNNPSTQLDVAGTGAFKRINIYDSTYNANPRLCVGRHDGEDFKFYVDDMSTKLTAYQDLDGNGDHRFILDREFAGTGVNSFHIANSGNYQLTIDKDNKIGMGYNSPSDFDSEANRLVIGDGAGSEGMTVYAGTSSSASIFFADGTAGSETYRGIVQYRHSDDRLDFWAGAGRRMSVDGNGVGIGTYTITSKLEVSGAHSSTIAKFRNGSNAVEITDDAEIQASGWISSHSTGTSRIYTSEAQGDVSANSLMIETDGAGNRTRLANYGTSTHLLIEGKGNNSDIHLNSREAIRFYTSGSASSYSYGSQKMTIAADGNVGIGSATPAYKLDVAGDIALDRWLVHRGNTGSYFGFHSNDNFRIQTDNTTALTVTDAQKVGIGTTNPAYELDVNGTISGDKILGKSGIYTYGKLGSVEVFGSAVYTDTIRVTNIQDKASNGNAEIVFGGSNKTIDFETNATSRMLLSSGGYLGIGTSSPSAKVHVNGPSAGFSEIMRLQRDGGNYYSIGLDNGDLNFCYNGQSADGSTLVIDGAADSVGIGTKSPAYKLDVQDTAAELAQIKRTNAGNCEFLVNPSAGDAKVVFQNSGTDIWAIGKDNSDSSFRISEGGALETNPRFTVDNGGNVGIGTTNPEDLLTISAGAGGSTTDLINVGGTGNGRILVRHIDGKDSVSAATGPLFLNYGISENVLLAYGGGKVGIGATTSPESKVHIYGGNSTQTFSNIDAGLAVENDGSSASHYVFQTATAGGGKSFSITNAGKVGIGSTSPAYELDVAGSIQAKDGGVFAGINGDADGFIFHDLAAGSNYWGYKAFSSSSRLSMVTDGREGLTLDANSRVGIGSTAPAYHLDIADAKTIRIDSGSANSTAIRVGGGNNDVTLMRVDSVGGTTDDSSYGFSLKYMGSRNGDYNALSVWADDQTSTHHEAVTIDQKGKVGIGSSSPSNKLDIAGDLYVSEEVGIGTSPPTTSKLAVEGTIQTKVYAIGSLPSASPAGQRAMVNNSYYTFGSSVVGSTVYAGGSAVAPVYSDGSYWRYG